MAGGASAAVKSFSNTTFISIPDSGTATPYPSTVNVSGFAGNVQKATVTLHGLDHTYPDDLAVLLVGPTGTNSILMGRVGGDAGTETGAVDLTFDQSATQSLDTSTTATSGTYLPSEGSTTPNPLSAPAPSGPTYPVNLNVFNGTPADGTWQLFVEDQAAGDHGMINGGWTLNLTGPYGAITAGKPKLNKKNGTAKLPVTTQDSGKLGLRGKGVATVSSAGAVVSKAVGPGTTKLKVKATGKTRSKLDSTGKATVKVKITFTPTGGTQTVTKKKITLRKG